ncbi:MAG: RDD family protein [Candidatus Thorarchaeota archaeon]
MATSAIDLKGQTLAGTGARIIAMFIDLIIVGVIGGVFMFGLPEDLAIVGNLITLVVSIAYFMGLTEYTDGQTVGKMVMNVKVMALDESNAVVSIKGNWVANFLRWLLYIIDVGLCCLIGIILVWQTENKQRLGDMIGKTVVVRA